MGVEVDGDVDVVEEELEVPVLAHSSSAAATAAVQVGSNVSLGYAKRITTTPVTYLGILKLSMRSPCNPWLRPGYQARWRFHIGRQDQWHRQKLPQDSTFPTASRA